MPGIKCGVRAAGAGRDGKTFTLKEALPAGLRLRSALLFYAEETLPRLATFAHPRLPRRDGTGRRREPAPQRSLAGLPASSAADPSGGSRCAAPPPPSPTK